MYLFVRCDLERQTDNTMLDKEHSKNVHVLVYKHNSLQVEWGKYLAGILGRASSVTISYQSTFMSICVGHLFFYLF